MHVSVHCDFHSLSPLQRNDASRDNAQTVSMLVCDVEMSVHVYVSQNYFCSSLPSQGRGAPQDVAKAVPILENAADKVGCACFVEKS